jgi:hypothetical protein
MRLQTSTRSHLHTGGTSVPRGHRPETSGTRFRRAFARIQDRITGTANPPIQASDPALFLRGEENNECDGNTKLAELLVPIALLEHVPLSPQRTKKRQCDRRDLMMGATRVCRARPSRQARLKLFSQGSKTVYRPMSHASGVLPMLRKLER